MNEDRLREDYARILDERRPAHRDGCVPPEGMAAIVQGEASEEDRMTWLLHISGCAACRAELDLLRAADAAGRRLDARRSWWTGARIARAAAVVLLVVGAGVVWRAIGAGPASTGTRGAGTAVELIAPTGDLRVFPSRTFTWRSVPQALSYQFELLDGNGALVLRRETTDPQVRLPESITLVPGVEYRWWVQVRMRDGSVRDSPLQAFRILER